MATVLAHQHCINLSNGMGVRPPLKWAGGKRWLVPHLKPLIVDAIHTRLVEPFCGGLAVTLGALPEEALLNDINPHAINFYHWLQKGFNPKLDMRNEEQAYYACRERFNELVAAGKENTREAAELFFYLNRTGYNGLCRFNSKGGFNVPYGRYKTINYQQHTSLFGAYKQILSKWQFSRCDFESLVLKGDDLIYADPPYDVEFTQYSKENFSWDDQQRLAEWLSKHQGPVILSNQATDRILKLYKKLGFKTKILQAPRMISCTGDRTRADEVLALRNV